VPDPFLDACALADMVRRGEVSPAELVEEAIERIERVDPQLNAVIRPRFDEARREVAAGLPDGATSWITVSASAWSSRAIAAARSGPWATTLARSGS